MLQITVDVFSGRPNPSWSIEDEGQARELLREIVRLRSTFAGAESTATTNLGFRKLVIEPLADEIASDFGLSAALQIPASWMAESRGRELIDRIMSSMHQSATTTTVAGGMEVPLESVQQFLLDLVATSSRETV